MRKRNEPTKKKESLFICSLDGKKMSITKIQLNFFRFMAENGFFREIAPLHYISLSPKLANLLNTSYVTDIILTPEEQQSFKPSFDPRHLQSFFEPLLDCDTVSEASFAFHMLYYLTNLYTGFYISRRGACDEVERSETTRIVAASSLGDLNCNEVDTKQRFEREESNEDILELVFETPTEGSNFEEVNRNEHTRRKKAVKKKINKPIKLDENNLDIDNENVDPEVLQLAKDWTSWAESKMPWHIKPNTHIKYYNSLQEIKKKITTKNGQLNNDGLVAIFNFIRKDKFWQNQAVSPAKLLTVGRNEFRKIDYILLQMQKNTYSCDEFLTCEDFEF